MGRNLETWCFIRKNLELKIPTVLLYVVESLGSSPGREGFCMAVNQNGELEGSIGGGIMEHKFVERAKEMLRKADAEISIHRQIHDKSAPKQQSGIICSGEQTILIYPVLNEHLNAIQRLIAKKKIEKMMNDYKSERLDETWLSSIFAPVGMDIKSQTPEEIAISIAAQIIAVKNHAF